MRTRITADWVVGHEAGRHCLIEQGDVVYQDARITFVGHTFPGEVDVTHDYGKALIAPGFIDLDALANLDTTILGFDNQPGWRKGRVWPQSYMDRGPVATWRSLPRPAPRTCTVHWSPRAETARWTVLRATDGAACASGWAPTPGHRT